MSPFIFFHIFSCLSNNILLPSPIINTIMIIMFMVQWIFHWMNSTNYWVIILFEVTIIIIVHYVFEKSFNYKYVLIILFHYIHVFPIVFYVIHFPSLYSFFYFIFYSCTLSYSYCFLVFLFSKFNAFIIISLTCLSSVVFHYYYYY